MDREEEFYESDVMFSESDSDEELNNKFKDEYNSHNAKYMRNKKKLGRSSISSTGPVNIPEINRDIININAVDDEDYFGYQYGDLDHHHHHREMVPPHVIMDRRMELKMACSVYAPNGRVLKGRNLCQVRNSILKMTGFLES